jgi:maleylacetate reductase
MSYFQASFDARSAAVRVRFGPGVRYQLADEIGQLGCRRALILSTPPQADSAMEMAADLKGMAAGVFTRAAMHTPVAVTEEAMEHARSVDADCLVATWRGINDRAWQGHRLPHRSSPDRHPDHLCRQRGDVDSGADRERRKTTLTDPKVQPEVILYDAELVRTLPVPMTVTSALNAMAHAAEALYAENRNPISTMLAIEGLRPSPQPCPG